MSLKSSSISLAVDKPLTQNVLTDVLALTLDVGTYLIFGMLIADSYGVDVDLGAGTGTGTFNDGFLPSVGGNIQAGYGSVAIISLLTVTAKGTFKLQANAGQASTNAKASSALNISGTYLAAVQIA